MADPTPIRAPDELQPAPRDTANTLGGGIDAADLPPPATDVPGTGSQHDATGWRAVPPAQP